MRIRGRSSSGEGVVVDIRTPADLPDLTVPGAAQEARAFLESLHVVRVAIISVTGYRDGVDRMFTALQDEDGRWFDLKGQHLEITAL